MPATSVTGRGLGMANGKYKPENNSRTCCSESTDNNVKTRTKCTIKVKNCNKLSVGSYASTITGKYCSI
jgi:hypothetical protein